jgi:hypothetical protein
MFPVPRVWVLGMESKRPLLSLPGGGQGVTKYQAVISFSQKPVNRTMVQGPGSQAEPAVMAELCQPPAKAGGQPCPQ